MGKHQVSGNSNLADSRLLFVFFVVTALLALFPMLIAFLTGYDFATFANESLGYRYFFARGMFTGEYATFLPQGQLTSLLQKFPIAIIRAFDLDRIDLRTAYNFFGRTTLLTSNAILLLGLILAWRDRWIPTTAKLTVFFCAVAPLLSTVSSGIYYAVLPDYYHLNMVFIPWSVYLFLRFYFEPLERRNWPRLVACGIFMGLAITSKASLLPFAGLPLAPVVFRSRKTLRSVLTEGFSAVGIALLTSTVVLWALYSFRLKFFAKNIPGWWKFLTNPGSEPNFWESGFRFFLRNYNYDWFGIFFLIAFVSALVFWRKSRSLWVLIYAFAVSVVDVYAVIKRPAGTTMFESGTHLLGLGAALLGILSPFLFTRRMAWGLMSLLLIGGALTFDRTYLSRMFFGEFQSESIWEFNRALRALNKPIVFIIPDNNYAISVEASLIKGIAFFPTWEIHPEGTAVLNELYPAGLQFRSDQGGHARPEVAYPTHTTVAWVDLATETQKIPDRYATLRAAINRKGTRCQSLPLYGMYSGHYCELP